MALIDIVSVYHNERNTVQFEDLRRRLLKFEGVNVNVVGVDNREDNRGFARGSNWGAKQGSAPIVGFVNPDATVVGRFVTAVQEAFADEEVVIAGCRYGKPEFEIRAWGCREWVCGATMFVRREWFEKVGGFFEGYSWGWEDTDLVRMAQAYNRKVLAIPLPFHHESPHHDTATDIAYKRKHFDAGAHLFRRRWR